MSHARVEEISDSDSDPDIDDISTVVPAPAPSQRHPSILNPSVVPTTEASAPRTPNFDAATAKRWVCLYPVYFDANKTRQEGRRVGSQLAVKNPLARTIADAVAQAGLRVYFDAGKTHPKDWSNPGRVKAELRDQDGNLKRPNIKNKHHLYILVAKYLQAHPTTPETPFKLPIRGMPLPEEPPPPPSAPRGWKLNTILPLHSPAVTGGGVSENLLKDMMAEMQGGSPGGSGSLTPSGGSKKKDKKKGK
ncbi:uncharacterized protein PV09_04192 [Verruconis gallopava]|uniref:Signal recognition particle, SRP19 subunit n=1 Tax=Verruconis gallopava TaxID=253628 RepID=A0A0D1XQW5_9PEZI|nr:uncharacterized protein PV09_04192 [Verruconis gallopava]KIW05036.1 hypothetical protein PV09_04192 [Verruconis gallopava]